MVTDKLIKILILSNFVGENVTDKMKPEEKNKLGETINKANFNLTGWNDKIFKNSLKFFLNLGKYLFIYFDYYIVVVSIFIKFIF